MTFLQHRLHPIRMNVETHHGCLIYDCDCECESEWGVGEVENKTLRSGYLLVSAPSARELEKLNCPRKLGLRRRVESYY